MRRLARTSWSQWQRTSGVVVLCSAVGSGVFVGSVAGQGGPPISPAALDEFSQKVLPVLSNSCMGCHNNQEYAGDLSLEMFKDPQVVLKRPEVWAKVHDMVTSGKMPPRTVEPLASSEAATLTGWIERAYGVKAVHTDPATADPGRVTARRLTRLEYNNTVRDLLGVTLRPADEFPVDDSGYGFDNIGDVLTMSPMLMEKYMTAARTLSKAAVHGEPYPTTPGLLVKLSPKRRQDDLPATATTLPHSIRGRLDGTYHFPVDAVYEFRWRYEKIRSVPRAGGAGPARGGGAGRAGRGAGAAAPIPTPGVGDPVLPPAAVPPPGAPAAPQAAAPAGRGRVTGPAAAPTPEEIKARDERNRTALPPELMVFTVDGKVVYEKLVEGITEYDYDRGDEVVRLRLTAGDHTLRISWPGHANIADPLKLYSATGQYRQLSVDYLDIRGPYEPSKEPPAGFKKIFICGAPGKYTPQCARQIVENLALRAYRRPPTPAETQRLLALVNQVQRQDTFEEGIRVAIEAMLMSPNFLFRIERDQPRTPQSAASAVR